MFFHSEECLKQLFCSKLSETLSTRTEGGVVTKVLGTMTVRIWCHGFISQLSNTSLLMWHLLIGLTISGFLQVLQFHPPYCVCACKVLWVKRKTSDENFSSSCSCHLCFGEKKSFGKEIWDWREITQLWPSCNLLCLSQPLQEKSTEHLHKMAE